MIRLWSEGGLSSTSRNHLTTFCRPFSYYACLKLCSAIVHFIQNNSLYFVCYGWSVQTSPKCWFGKHEWRQIMTLQTTHTKYKWHHTPLNETPPRKVSAYATGVGPWDMLHKSTLRSYNGRGKRYCDMSGNLVFKFKKGQWPKIAKFILFKSPKLSFFSALPPCNCEWGEINFKTALERTQFKTDPQVQTRISAVLSKKSKTRVSF